MEAVHKAPRPANAKEVRSFLGLTNYISRSILHYTKITKPLRDLTCSAIPWEWTSEHDMVVKELQSYLTSSIVMTYYSSELETKVVVDADPMGLGQS